jgi:hypothetical protein
MSGRFRLVLLLTLLIGIAFAQRQLTLADGTAVDVRLKSELSSQRVRNGDTIEFEVVAPVRANGDIVIPKGAVATAKVLGTARAGRWGRNGQLAWTMESVTASDGTKIPLRFIKEPAQGGAGARKESPAKTAAAVGAMSPLILYYSPAIAVLIPFAAAAKGRPEVIPAGERYLVFVNGDTRVSIPESPRP